jgi:hypothetical protein
MFPQIESVCIYIAAKAFNMHIITIDFTDSVHPVTWYKRHHLTMVTAIYSAEVEEFVLSEIWPEGKRVRTTDGLRQLFTGLYGVIETRV